MGPALFLVIEDWPDGVYLFRYGADGDFVGDTWHRNIEDAKHQADYEYGGAATDWAPVPADVEDAVAFGVARVRQTR